MRLTPSSPRLLYGRQLPAVLFAVLILCATAAGVLGGQNATAATASTINFQARLMNASGSIAPDGNYNIEFKIYDTASTGGTAQGVCTGNCKWVETRTSTDVVTVANGYVTVNLGSVTAFGAGINWDQDLWLTMNIGGTSGTPSWDGEMSPRLKLTAVPYAFRAAQLSRLAGSFTGTLELASSFGQDSTITLPDPGASTATVCYQSSSSCGFATGTASSYIQNGTTVQTGANFNIRSNAVGSVTGVLQGANGQTADLFDVQTWDGATATTVFGISNVGDLTVQNVNLAANKSITLASGTGTYTQSYNNTSGVAATFGVTDSASSGTTTVQGVAINLTGTNNAGGSNTITGLDFGNVAAATNNSYYGINFGTGFTDLLRYNGTQLISGAGIVQSSAISGSYTSITGVGTLTAGALGSGFTTINVGQGGTGATTFTSNGLLYGNGTGALQVTAAGATGQCLVGNTGVAPSWDTCASGTVTLQTAYDNSTNPEIVLDGTRGALTIRDSSGGISANLLEIQNNVASTTYLGLTVSALTLGSNVDLSLQGATAYISNPQAQTNSESFGLDAAVTNQDALAVGNGATAQNSRSIALGRLANANGDDGIAIGYQATASGNGGIAIGRGSNAGFGSIALGYSATTTANNQLVIGSNSSEITQLVLGSGVTDATPNSVTLQATGGSGTDVAGASITIAAGQGTGTGAGGNIVLQTASAGGTGSSLNSLVTRATFDTNNYLYLGNGLTAASPSNFVISGTGSTTTAVAGGSITLQGGNATVGSANGGNVTLTGGSGFGSGVRGLVVIDTPTFTTASTQSCAVSCTVTQANVDSNGAVVVNATDTSLTVTLPDPTITTAGRIIYVTASGASNDFTLSVNGGGTGNQISMRQNTTATMIWNGSDWTAAGASSSTTLQAAYDNTLSSAGGAEIVLNNTATSNGLTVRNSSTSPIIGAILEAQTSIGSNLFSVNNNAIEYASNGGAETAGGTSTTFPSSTWSASATGGSQATVSRDVTTGEFVTGLASVKVVTTGSTTGGQGAANQIVLNGTATALTANLVYSVSFTVKGSTNFSTLDVVYSKDGTNTSTTSCITGETVTQSVWSRVDCTFTAPASGITSSNAIFIRQSDSDTSAKTFYIDNLSVTVNANTSHAADGSVDAALGTNWEAYDADGGTGTSTPTRDTSTLYDTSASVAIATTTGSGAGEGVRNNLAITPQVSTQYLVTFYAKSSTAFSDITVGFLPAGGSSLPSAAQDCTDYNTQTVSTTGFTKITCIITTPSSGITDPDVVIYQGSSAARTFHIDALTVTLNTNNSSNVQVGGGTYGGPTTLFTLDRSSSAPIASNNDAYLGSMYYDTTSGRIQCYEADGWGACGAAPDNIVNLNPEYAGAVLNGSGTGTMTADICSNDTALSVNSTLCSTGQAKNYYKWTSPQANQQTYSIYVSYQLPSTFNGFASDDTVQLVGRTSSTTDAAVTYEMYKSTGSAVTQCGSGETTVVTTANTWQSVGISGNESTGCSFTSSSAGNFIIFKINVKAKNNASAYVSTLSFTTTGR